MMHEREFTEKIMELIEDFYGDEIESIKTLKDSGILTKDTGLEVMLNNERFYVTIQKGGI